MLYGGAMNNKLIIAAAGSGKTTHLVQEAHKKSHKKILITTFTDNNASEIKQKFIALYGSVPSNVTVLPWVSFLLTHCVRPYQSCYDMSLHDVNIGFLLVSEKSGAKYQSRAGHTVYWKEEENFKKHYFNNNFQIYSDKISKFVIKNNERSNNAVFSRLKKIFDCVYIDEIQDMVGYDLEIIKLFLKEIEEVLLVGDPRQCTYSTHNAQKHTQYAEGNIENFIREKLGRRITCEIDTSTLNVSHRNFKEQCDFSSLLYPQYPVPTPCSCAECRGLSANNGLFLVKSVDVKKYLLKTKAVQLRWDIRTQCHDTTPCFNMGESKGMTFEHTLIYLTVPMVKWLKDRTYELNFSSKAKFYVALTRAKYSVAIVWDAETHFVPEFTMYSPEDENEYIVPMLF